MRDVKLFVLFFTLIVAVLISFLSCTRMSPAGFWCDFKKDSITDMDSDQGPFGGHRRIVWKSADKNTFILSDIVDFATKNDWCLVDSIDVVDSEIFNDREEDYSLFIVNKYVLPRITAENVTIYVFTTGWLAIKPGNAEETLNNGFVVLSKDRKQLMLYHLWGE